MKKNLIPFFLLGVLFSSLSTFAQKACTTNDRHISAKANFKRKHIDSTGRGLADNYYLWNNGEVIKIKFLSGSTSMQEKVKTFASEWLQYANLKFQYVSQGPADIRILLGEDNGHNSFIGTVSRMISEGEETMNLDTTDFVTALSMKGTVLHEFGHAIGLLHEHSSPVSGIQWNKDSIYKVYRKYYGWDKEQVDFQVFATYNESYTNGTSYDKRSIMHYSIDPWETKNGYTVPWNYHLSAGDKALIAALYPKKGARINDVPRVSIQNFQRVAIQENAKKGGLSLFPTFELNAFGKSGTAYVLAEFYDEFHEPILDTDGEYSFENRVTAIRSMNTVPGKKVSYNQSKKDFEIFIPYDQLELGEERGKINVLFRVVTVSKDGEIKDVFYAPRYSSYSFSK